MKCIALVVMMALAAANAAFVKTVPAPVDYKTYSLGYPYAPYFARAYPGALAYDASPFVYSAPYAPIVVAAPQVKVSVPKPTYIASNPGITHVAELPGHEESVIAENLELAPGTF